VDKEGGFMIRRIRMRRLLILPLCVGLAAANLAAAQAPATPAPDAAATLEEVVVSGSRLPDAFQALRRVPGQVYSITRDEIEQSHPRDVPEALRQVPGIVLSDISGNGLQPIVDLRGFNAQPAPGVTVFVDGVRVNEPDSNTVNWDLIPIQDVERIEVLPGATAIYGRNALGGVINIVTRRGGQTPQTTIETAFGSYARYRVLGNTSGAVKGLDYYLSGSLDRESGFRHESDGRLSRLSGRMGYRPSSTTDLNLSFQYVNDSLEQAGVLRLDDLGRDRRTNISPVDLYANELVGFTLNGRQGLPWGFAIAANGFYRQTSQESRVVGLTSVSRATTETDSTGGTLQLSHELQFAGRKNSLAIGGELQHGGVDLTTGGAFFGFPFFSRTLVDEDAAAFFATDTLDLLPNLALTGAVRYDVTRLAYDDQVTPANNGEKRYSRWTPRVGLAYTPWTQLTVYGNYGEGFRVPTSTELFGFGVGFSDPNLRPMTSRTWEAGVRTRPSGWLEFRGALFLSDVKDEIIFDPSVPPFGQNRNLPETRRQGVEAETRLRPHERVDLQLTYTYTDARFRNSATYSSGVVEKGDRVPLVPQHRLQGVLTYRPVSGLELSLDGTYVGRQVLLNDEPNARADRIQDTFVLGARASYTWKQFTWFVRGGNLTNTHYETYGLVSGGQVFMMSAAGANVFGGITVRLEDYF
jgi:iron complex outermembrane recepter protein